MKKYFVYFSVLSVLLVFGQALTSCISDGDETISLEFANAKKMIVGRWKLSAFDKDGSKQSPKKFPFSNWKVVDTELTFYDDGTYYDSSDGGKKPHRWRLGPDGDNDSKPYYGDIYLEDYEFDINSLGPGRWILGFDDDDNDGKPTWILSFDKDDSEIVEPEPEPEPETEERYLVSSIKRAVKSNSYNRASYYLFDYDDRGRILTIQSKEGYPKNISFSYDDEKSAMIVKDIEWPNDLKGMQAQISDGKIVSVYAPNNQITWEFSYDSGKKEYLQSVVRITENEKKTCCTLNWNKENMESINTKNYNYEYWESEKNNTNLDLNYFIWEHCELDGMIFGDDIACFEPFALYGKKSKNLVIPLRYGLEAWKTNEYYGKGSVKVTRNQNDLPTEIVYTNIDLHGATLTLTIEYQKKTVLK
ncbi:MAG: hypothetical protein IKS94_04160 [Prevotella sp.]|nr:hypothetical protein [Prevotella sp.]